MPSSHMGSYSLLLGMKKVQIGQQALAWAQGGAPAGGLRGHQLQAVPSSTCMRREDTGVDPRDSVILRPLSPQLLLAHPQAKKAKVAVGFLPVVMRGMHHHIVGASGQLGKDQTLP